MSAAPGAPSESRSYGSGARILSIGLALTGVVTFAFFSLSTYALGDVAYQPVALLWALTFIVCSVIYRPIEQLLARTLADARGHGRTGSRDLRIAVLLEAGAGLGTVALALAFKSTIQDNVFSQAPDLYWVFVAAIAAYSVSYFARGWLAGSGRPDLYGALVFIESTGRCLFPIAALIGLTEGSLAVALGIAAAPLLSLLVVPLALRGGISTAATAVEAEREIEALSPDGPPGESIPADAHAGGSADAGGLTFRSGLVFALSVVVVMAAEQTLITAGVLTEGAGAAALVATTGAAAAIFNAFLVARAPLQLFQAIQSTLLPHLAELRTSGDQAAAAKALRQTMLAIAAFAAAVSLGLLVLGPWAMGIFFEYDWDYTSGSLALVGVGMGLHLAAGTLNQSALAHGRAPLAAVAWAGAAAFFLWWMLSEPVAEPVLRAASGYAVASGLLLAGLLAVESRSLRSS
ncbi:MAG: hypothetical protein JHD16_02860 [Solirubrobacteraceae bacterium]|nr:hypothetical protein [Solirubrobacteraceae bacterium]